MKITPYNNVLNIIENSKYQCSNSNKPQTNMNSDDKVFDLSKLCCKHGISMSSLFDFKRCNKVHPDDFHSAIENRVTGKYKNIAFYLNKIFHWKLKYDEDTALCLIPSGPIVYDLTPLMIDDIYHIFTHESSKEAGFRNSGFMQIRDSGKYKTISFYLDSYYYNWDILLDEQDGTSCLVPTLKK